MLRFCLPFPFLPLSPLVSVLSPRLSFLRAFYLNPSSGVVRPILLASFLSKSVPAH